MEVDLDRVEERLVFDLWFAVVFYHHGVNDLRHCFVLVMVPELFDVGRDVFLIRVACRLPRRIATLFRSRSAHSY